jgi:hypothetical protein
MSQVHNVTHVPVHSRAWQILDYEYLARTLARASAVDAEHLSMGPRRMGQPRLEVIGGLATCH